MSDRLIKQPSHLDLQFLLEQVGEGYVAKGKSFLKQNPRTKMVELFAQAFYILNSYNQHDFQSPIFLYPFL